MRNLCGGESTARCILSAKEAVDKKVNSALIIYKRVVYATV